MNILTCDISTKNIGWAYFSKGRYVASGVVSNKGDNAKQRVYDLTAALLAEIPYGRLDLVLFEDGVYCKNSKAMSSLWFAQGYVAYPFITKGIPIKEVHNKRWKMALTGNGNSSKEECKEITEQKIGKKIKSLDEADAIGMAIGYLLMKD